MNNLTSELAGVAVYRASTIGYCPYALWLDRMGVTGEAVPGWLEVKFQQGKDLEDEVIRRFESQQCWKRLNVNELINRGYTLGKNEGYSDYSRQPFFSVTVGNKAIITCHPDGIAELWNKPPGYKYNDDGEGDRRVLEVKAFARSTWDTWKRKGLAAFPKYAWQMSVQMRGSGLKGVFVVGLKGELSDSIVDVDVLMVDQLPVKWVDVIRKVMGIENSVGGKGGAPKCVQPYDYPCGFFKLHGEREAEIVELDVEEDLVLSLYDEYERHKVLEKINQDKKKAASQAVGRWFDEKGFKGQKVRVNGRVISDQVQDREGGIDVERLLGDLKLPVGFKLEKYRKQGYTVRFPQEVKKGRGKSGGGSGVGDE